MKLLLVEDDNAVAETVLAVLASYYSVDRAETGDKAVKLALANDYDGIVLDVGLPDISGLEVCKKLRSSGSTVPVIILTGQFQRSDDIVTGLDSGADDYLTKPFEPKELLARIRALLRRSPQLSQEKMVVGELTLDLAKRRVERGGRGIALRRKEFDLLDYMARNPNRVLTRQMIFDHVWDSDANSFNNTVDVHIKYLRDKIDRANSQKLIKTVYGLGYKLEI